jgi:hypothetical protein
MEKIQLGLVVHSLDGCLELEKRMLLENQQKISTPVDISMNDTVKKIPETSSEEMESLLMSVTDVNLIQTDTQKLSSPTEQVDSMDLIKSMRHRTKHPNAEVPLLKNTLKLIQKKR